MEIIAMYKFVFEDSITPLNIYNSILPEVNINLSKKMSKVTLFFEDSITLILTIKSENISLLRATSNTCMNLIKVAIEINTLLKKRNLF